MIFSKPIKTVESILSTFTSMVQQLQEVSEQCKENILINEEKVSELLKDNQAQKAEKDKADAAIAKLNSIISQ